MKRFFPSTIMLTPFLVKYYRHQEEYCPESILESDDESPESGSKSGKSTTENGSHSE